MNSKFARVLGTATLANSSSYTHLLTQKTGKTKGQTCYTRFREASDQEEPKCPAECVPQVWVKDELLKQLPTQSAEQLALSPVIANQMVGLFGEVARTLCISVYFNYQMMRMLIVHSLQNMNILWVLPFLLTTMRATEGARSKFSKQLSACMGVYLCYQKGTLGSQVNGLV